MPLTEANLFIRILMIWTAAKSAVSVMVLYGLQEHWKDKTPCRFQRILIITAFCASADSIIALFMFRDQASEFLSGSFFANVLVYGTAESLFTKNPKASFFRACIYAAIVNFLTAMLAQSFIKAT